VKVLFASWRKSCFNTRRMPFGRGIPLHKEVVMTARSIVVLTLVVVFGGTVEARTRHYYIQAEDVTWDFAPSGQDLVHGGPIPDPWTNSHVFQKTRYVEYTDAGFRTPKAQPVWLGVLGPVIRAEVGDTVIVHFRNNAPSGSYGMHPHGFRYTKDNEGAHYEGVNSGQAPGAGAEVMYGESFDYEWIADQDSGPGPGDPSSIVWWYHSHINEPVETNRGLIGPIVITRRGAARQDGTPKDVDAEFVTAYFIFDELEGEEPGLMHSINGYIFGNLKGLVMHDGDRVRWYVLGMGNEIDLHSPHWHGKTVRVGGPIVGRRTDTISLLPGIMVTADMKADNPGEWMLHCHVSDHVAAGMLTSYQILPGIHNAVPDARATPPSSLSP
jgi:FtsP/CotA-like multicopper oxidase with cupredoxin domain